MTNSTDTKTRKFGSASKALIGLTGIALAGTAGFFGVTTATAGSESASDDYAYNYLTPEQVNATEGTFSQGLECENEAEFEQQQAAEQAEIDALIAEEEANGPIEYDDDIEISDEEAAAFEKETKPEYDAWDARAYKWMQENPFTWPADKPADGEYCYYALNFVATDDPHRSEEERADAAKGEIEPIEPYEMSWLLDKEDLENLDEVFNQ